MDTRFLPHNLHLTKVELFAKHDPNLQVLAQQKYIYRAPILDEIPRDIPGIYTLCGGRQIGKTTLLKQWMLSLLESGVEGKQIAFLTGELIDDHHALNKLVTYQLNEMPKDKTGYLIIDEITYIRDWDKAIKFLADSGLIRNVILVITGSDLVILQQARMRFPGRRGKSDKVNFQLHTLSFYDFLQLTKQLPAVNNIADFSPKDINIFYEAFDQYLIHGGYLTAINEFAQHGKIHVATLDIYAEWIRGDMLKREKRENYLQEIIQSIIKRYNTQISWINLAQDLSIDHPQTVSDYISTLESMDAVFIQHALIEDKLVAAPKKHKKVMFTDPFIFHAMNYWVNPVSHPFENLILPTVQNPATCSKLVESVCITHVKRKYPTFYIKADGEVDIAYVNNKKFWPIEVKWTQQLRVNDLKQIQKYSNGCIWAKVNEISTMFDIPLLPVPLGLINFYR